MYLRSARIIALLALVISTLVAQRPATMRAFWQDSVKGPLTGPGSDQLFISTYKDAHLPPTDMRPYFEGSVVSVSSGTGGQSVLLTVEGSETAEATLRFDGRLWKLRSQPPKGTMVRFNGTIRGFTKDPFMVIFEPERVMGLDVETTEPNRPF